MPITQYPYYLFVHTVPGSTQDGNGDWQKSIDYDDNGDPVVNNDSWDFFSVCRDETNGKGLKVNNVDGESILFSATIYMPKTTKIAEGTEVMVSGSKTEPFDKRIQGEVLKCEVGQLNCRIWL